LSKYFNETAAENMLKSFLRDRLFLALLFSAIFIKLFSLNEYWVEQYYSNGFYPFISKVLRALLGWIPFSVGDVLYVLAGIFLVLKTWKFVKLLTKRKVKGYLSWVLFRKYVKLVLWVYIIFNVFWGLNYNRLGIAHQLELEIKTFDKADLHQVILKLHERVNFYAAKIDSVQRLRFNNNGVLFDQAINDYELAGKQYSFLRYSNSSLKASLYGNAGKYFAYTGYYNPFTAEAQIKTTIPVFLKPFVMNHEIAHQLGYAKENEASFVSYLVGKNSNSIEFRYSVYYELFFDAFFQYFEKETLQNAMALMQSLHPRIMRDKRDQFQYLKRNRNSIAPFMSRAYDTYLKINNQPKGKKTYSEVITWLLAYSKKFGIEAI
jgi:hypothetical protein